MEIDVIAMKTVGSHRLFIASFLFVFELVDSDMVVRLGGEMMLMVF